MSAVRREILPTGLARVLRLPLFLLYAFPLYWIIATSLKSRAELNSNPTGLLFDPTLDSYRAVFTTTLVSAASSTLQIALGTTVVVMLLAVPAAFAVSQLRGPVRVAVLAALLLFQLMPPAAALIPLYRLLYEFSLLGTIPGLVLVDAAAALPFAVILLQPFAVAMPRETIDAAALDGAGPLRFLLSVFVPMTRNGILVVAVITFTVAWGEFLAAITFINEPSLQPLSALIASSVTTSSVNYGSLTALAVIASVPLFVIYVLSASKMRDGLTAGSVR